MWKCIRCEKENQDSREQCVNCGHGRTMDYTGHCVLSKIHPEITARWKQKKQKPTLMADCMEDKRETVLGSKVLRKEICEIEFVRMNFNNIPKGAWDVSADRSRTIWAWANTGTKGLSLKIGSESGVYANSDCKNLFYQYINLEAIHFHDLFDTSHVTDMFMMFNNCRKLKRLDVSSFDTKNVTDMCMMFGSCRKLKSLDVSSFDTKNVTDLRGMFICCKELEHLDISGFNTKNVTDMGRMFQQCETLKNLDVSGLDTKKVTNMESMFAYCTNLENLDISGFDTANVMDMREMFANCKNLRKLDTSNFYFREDVKIENMFQDCGTEKIEAPRKYPLTQNQNSVVRVLSTYEDNWAELKKRKVRRVYTEFGIKEICKKFLSYEANQSVNNVENGNSQLLENLQIYQNHNIYLLHDDTWRKNGQSGFAVTDQGIYTKALFKKAKFIPWKEFQKCEVINISGDSELSAGKNQIAFLSGDRDTLLELELMFAAIHEYLNQK